jgi:hypothetical protein
LLIPWRTSAMAASFERLVARRGARVLLVRVLLLYI